MNIETANRLYEYRKANGYSQEELAEKIGVSRQAISKWERSESNPDTDNLIALAKLYDVSLDELISGTSPINNGETKKEENETKDEPKVSFKRGIHVHDGKDDVDIDLNGIHVEDHEGNKVHIGRDCGIKVTTAKDGELSEEELKRKVRISSVKKKCDGLLSLLTIVAYLGVSFATHRWDVTWLIFFAGIVLGSLVDCIVYKDAKRFCVPILVAGIFLMIGMVYGIWHPTWIIFFAIPIYYAVISIFSKSPEVTYKAKPENTDE